MSNIRESLEIRARKAILQHAFFRWESAATIALTAMLAFFSAIISQNAGLSAAILLGGTLAEIAIVYTSMTDEKTAERVVAEMLRDEFKPTRLHNKQLRAQVNEALSYHNRIAAVARERDQSVLTDSLNDTVEQLDEWMEEVYDLAGRIDQFLADEPELKHTKQQAQQRLQQLESRLQREDDPRLQQDIQTNIESLKRRIQTIEDLENAMSRAKLRLEHTIIAMGTIHSQAMLAGAKTIDNSRAQRLRHEISEEVMGLSDILSAMDEVYASSQGMTDAI
ncbi:MAG TPA: hypothetical protein VLL52_02025 [Anaerolineae bacterium]|nr:hypothetical protein [Anaerolineae bacterium]